MKYFLALLILVSTSALAQYLPPLPPPPPPMPVGPCGQVFCPPPPLPPVGPCGLPVCPQPLPPAPIPQPAHPARSAYVVNVANIDTSHWVDISTGNFKMYLDDGNVVSDRPFNGMNVLFILPKPLVLQDSDHKGITAVSVIFLVEYNCHSNVGRFKVASFIDEGSHYYVAPSNQWEAADVLPSTAAAEAVKSRVCFHISI